MEFISVSVIFHCFGYFALARNSQYILSSPAAPPSTVTEINFPLSNVS